MRVVNGGIEQRPPFGINDDGRDADGHKPVVITILARRIVVSSVIRIDAYARVITLKTEMASPAGRP
jgi:hypothetical protein